VFGERVGVSASVVGNLALNTVDALTNVCIMI